MTATTTAAAAIAGRLAMIRAHGNLGDPSVALKVLDLEPCNRALPLAWCKTCGNPSDFDGRCACWCNLAGALQQYLGLDHDGSAQLAADLWDQLAERERVWSAAYAHDHDVEVYPDTRGFAPAEIRLLDARDYPHDEPCPSCGRRQWGDEPDELHPVCQACGATAGECVICGGELVAVEVMPEANWLDRGIPDYRCVDQDACQDRYDEETERSGWLR